MIFLLNCVLLRHHCFDYSKHRLCGRALVADVIDWNFLEKVLKLIRVNELSLTHQDKLHGSILKKAIFFTLLDNHLFACVYIDDILIKLKSCVVKFLDFKTESRGERELFLSTRGGLCNHLLAADKRTGKLRVQYRTELCLDLIGAVWIGR